MTDAHNVLDKHHIIEEQIRFWEENGYFISPSLFGEEELGHGDYCLVDLT